MKTRVPRWLAPTLIAAAIPAIAVAQAPPAPTPEPPLKRERPERPRLSPDALNRLQDGRIAMMREALKLDDSQLKLWAPVERQLRDRFAARRQARLEREQRMEQRRSGAAERPSPVDRLDRATKRMTDRAQRMQAFTDAFKPFYASLSDDQKAVAGIVLRDMRGGMRGPGRRWAMEHGPQGPGASDTPGVTTRPR